MRVPLSSLAVVAAIEGLEGGVLVGFAAYVVRGTIAGAVTDTTSAATLAVTIVVLALGVLLVARALYRRRRWARAPAALSQIFALPVAATFFQAGRIEVAVPLGAAAVLGLILLFHPATTRALTRESSASADAAG